jgi:hypothetical protein
MGAAARLFASSHGRFVAHRIIDLSWNPENLGQVFTLSGDWNCSKACTLAANCKNLRNCKENEHSPNKPGFLKVGGL